MGDPARAPHPYEVGFPIGCGGMAVVRYGRRSGAAGFAHAVAIKELLPHLAGIPAVVSMFLDEARLAARIAHPNVVPVTDVVADGDRVWIVMPYVEGESLARLMRPSDAPASPIPTPIAVRVALDLLEGLHAAHRACDERGEPLRIVHRDVSPQNVMVGTDGVARVVDFGVAKARGRIQETRDGQVKGKLAYMAPEQLGGDATAQSDVYAAGIVLWEMLAGRRLFEAENDIHLMTMVVHGATTPPSTHASVGDAVDAVVMRALAVDPAARFATAAEMASALADAARGAIASRDDIARWVMRVAEGPIEDRRRRAAAMAAEARAIAAPREIPAIASQTLDPVVVATLRMPAPASLPPRAIEPRSTNVADGITHGADGKTRASRARRLTHLGAAIAAALAVAATAGALVGVARARTPFAREAHDAHEARGAAPVAAAEIAAAGLVDVGSPSVAPPEIPPFSASALDAPAPSAHALGAAKGAAPPRARASSPLPSITGSSTSSAPSSSLASPSTSSPASSSSASGVASSASRADACDPPFVVDERGVRQYKRACIR